MAIKKLKMQELNSPEVLTRQQLKNVLGGSGAATTKKYLVSCTARPGYVVQSPGSCTGTQSGCQTQAKTYCTNTEGCASCFLI